VSDTTHIQWTDATWNTITGCTRVSDGCLKCYIDRTPPFRMAHRTFDSPEIGGKTGVIVHSDRVLLPLKWRKPRRIFVNSLSDLFHEDVPTEHIAQVFAIAALTRRHTYQILSKRPARMRSLLASEAFQRQVLVEAHRLKWAENDPPAVAWNPGTLTLAHWPLPNVWLGVSVESQKWADIRIPQLLDTPAAVRFLSCEPLLGPIDLFGDVHVGHESDDVNGFPHPRVCLTCSTDDSEVEYFRRERTIPGLGWAIVGGESGPGARPMDLNWAMDLVIQCSAAGVPVFVKQLGSVWARENRAVDRKGGTPDEWPVGLREREFPQDAARYVPQAVAS
jgi:protein gp37